MLKFATTSAMMAAAGLLAGCHGLTEAEFNQSAAQPLENDAKVAPIFVDWSQFAVSDDWYVSDHPLPGGHWKSDFASKNVLALPNGLNIKMTSKTPANESWHWDGGEIQHKARVKFGEYHTIMRAASGSGLVSSFFTYTGEYYGTPHEEIDFEFVGKSPYEVQLNSFTNGTSHGRIEHPVDFDTSKNFALYSFTWNPDRISWFVNGELVHEITSELHPIPQNPAILFANVFQGREEGWVGAPEFVDGAQATYRCMSYRPTGDTTSPTCAEIYDLEYNQKD
ncbi:MAG: family 16 glycosylhydrolase [Henriciella sp.]|nr:family 16 glycosylhydrolase [Henriciella sp.]